MTGDGWSRIRICLLRRACSPWPGPTPASAPSHAPSPVANNNKHLPEYGGILSFKNLKWAGNSFAALRRVAISGLESTWRIFCYVSSRIFEGFTRRMAVRVFIDFLNYENATAFYLYEEFLFHREGKDCV
jgi:hypothetical protein